MDDAYEFWDLYDENRDLTGHCILRGQAYPVGHYHLVVHVWIINSKKEFLISQRSMNKTFPLMWECTGGSATVGESSLQAALREANEEVGIVLNPRAGKCLFTKRRDYMDFPDFRDVWLFEAEAPLVDLVCQRSEVCDVKWATMDEILSMIEEGTFISHFEYLPDLFQVVKGSRRCGNDDI